MLLTDLTGKRILVTQADTFMGPALCETLDELGAHVIRDTRSLIEPGASEAAVRASGRVDALIANLAVPAPRTPVQSATDEEWRDTFAWLVDPLPKLVRAVLPQMLERKSGKIVLMGSASALRGMKLGSTYSAARGAQLAYIQAAGVELAPYNVQANAIAQNYVENPTYYPPEVQANPKFRERMQREVPLGRLVRPQEDAHFAAYLCSNAADCFVGQVFPMCGGWAK